jgi:hypothetical protein
MTGYSRGVKGFRTSPPEGPGLPAGERKYYEALSSGASSDMSSLSWPFFIFTAEA